MIKRIAVIGAILSDPETYQKEFNNTVASYKDIIRGRMGIPFNDEKVSVVSITVLGTLNEINSLTGKLGNIPSVTVKTALSKKDFE